MKVLPSKVALWAAMGNTVLLALALLPIVALFRRQPARMGNVGRILFTSALSIPLFGFYRVVSEQYQILRGELIRMIGVPLTVLLCGTAVGLFALMVWRWHTTIARWGGVVLIAFAPAVVLTFGQALVVIASPPSAVLADRPSPPPSPAARRSPRVVWLLFDEWDYRLTFPDRKRDLQLPEIDRLAQTTISATDAIPPARATAASVPMLLSGERYGSERVVAPGSFQVSPIDEPDHYLEWSSRDLIFSAARAMNFNTAVAGWYAVLPRARRRIERLLLAAPREPAQ